MVLPSSTSPLHVHGFDGPSRVRRWAAVLLLSLPCQAAAAPPAEPAPPEPSGGLAGDVRAVVAPPAEPAATEPSGGLATDGEVRLGFIAGALLAEPQSSYWEVDANLIELAGALGDPAGWQLVGQGRLISGLTTLWTDDAGETFHHFTDEWGRLRFGVGYGPGRVGLGTLIVKRIQLSVPRATAELLWRRAGQEQPAGSTLEDDDGIEGLLPSVWASSRVGPLALSASWEALYWSPLGWQAEAELSYQHPVGLTVRLATRYRSRQVALAQYEGGAESAAEPLRVPAGSWALRAGYAWLEVGYDFWAPFRALTPGFPGSVYLAAGPGLRHLSQNEVQDRGGAPVYAAAPTTQPNLRVWLSFSVRSGTKTSFF